MELFARFSTVISYLSGAGVRVGFHKFHMEGLYRGSLQTHNVLYNHLQHISLNFLALVCAAHEPADVKPHTKIPAPADRGAPPKIDSTQEAQAGIRRKIKNISPGYDESKFLVLLNPNGSNLLPLRRWPIKSYILLAQKLLAAHPSVYIAVTGTASEKKDAAAICDALRDERCINFAGETSLRELIDLYTVSHMLVSNDSGPPNFASLTSIPTLVLFGPETPRCYRPLGDNITAVYADYLCSPCVSAYNHRKSPCRDNKCMQAISVDEVYRRIARTLSLPE
jgi:ADP-heptose:LPS heptosyltransferase